MSDLFGRAEVVAEDPTRGEWLRLRQQGIGGSDVGAILGLDGYRSPLTVWAEKTGKVVDPDADSEAAKWGRLLEAPVREEAARQWQVTIDAPKALLRHPDYPWMLVTPDGIVNRSAIYEGKTAGYWIRDEWHDDATPDRAVLQAHWAAAITGHHEPIRIAALIAGQHLELRTIPVNVDLIERLVDEIADFWSLVESGQMPAVDGSESTTDTLARLFDRPNLGAEVEVDERILDVRGEFIATKAQIKQLEARRDELGNQLRAVIGDAEVATFHGEPVATWKQQTSHPFLQAEFKAAGFGHYEDFVGEKHIRVLRTPKTKAEKAADKKGR